MPLQAGKGANAAAWRRSAAHPGAGADDTCASWQPYTLEGPTGRLSPAALPPQRYPPPDARLALFMLWDAGRPWHARKGTHVALVPFGAQPYLIADWADALWTRLAHLHGALHAAVGEGCRR